MRGEFAECLDADRLIFLATELFSLEERRETTAQSAFERSQRIESTLFLTSQRAGPDPDDDDISSYGDRLRRANRYL
jgi:hypothetical protein